MCNLWYEKYLRYNINTYDKSGLNTKLMFNKSPHYSIIFIAATKTNDGEYNTQPSKLIHLFLEIASQKLMISDTSDGKDNIFSKVYECALIESIKSDNIGVFKQLLDLKWKIDNSFKLIKIAHGNSRIDMVDILLSHFENDEETYIKQYIEVFNSHDLDNYRVIELIMNHVIRIRSKLNSYKENTGNVFYNDCVKRIKGILHDMYSYYPLSKGIFTRKLLNFNQLSNTVLRSAISDRKDTISDGLLLFNTNSHKIDYVISQIKNGMLYDIKQLLKEDYWNDLMLKNHKTLIETAIANITQNQTSKLTLLIENAILVSKGEINIMPYLLKLLSWYDFIYEFPNTTMLEVNPSISITETKLDIYKHILVWCVSKSIQDLPYHAINIINWVFYIIFYFKLRDLDKVDPSFSDNYLFKMAAKNGYDIIVYYLLKDKRVDPTADNNYAIRFASYHGRKKVMERLLLNKRIDPLLNYQIEY